MRVGGSWIVVSCGLVGLACTSERTAPSIHLLMCIALRISMPSSSALYLEGVFNHPLFLPAFPAASPYPEVGKTCSSSCRTVRNARNNIL